jgi:hypothetical protein
MQLAGAVVGLILSKAKVSGSIPANIKFCKVLSYYFFGVG